MRLVAILFISLFILTTSCVTTRVQVGDYENIKCKSTVYKKDKDFYLFWNKKPIRRLEDKVTVKDYEKVSRRGFFDTIIYYGTLGTFCFYDVKIKIKECDKEQ